MKQTLFLVGVALMAATVRSDIVAEGSDFTVDCGTDPGKIVSVTYKSSNTGNEIAKLSSRFNNSTCSSTTTANAAGEWVISDVSTKCIITQPNADKPEYLLQVTIQEFADVLQKKDPNFFIRCNYLTKDVTVTSVIDDGGLLGTPVFIIENVAGDPDMTYSLEILDETGQPTSAAKFGDDIALRVTMSGTDDDEKGVQVKECEVRSGDVVVPIIEDYCVVESKKKLFQLNGFNTLLPGTSAVFPVTVFALEGSSVSSVEYACNVSVCAEPCDGLNCGTARRRRRAAGDEPTSDKSVLMSTKLQILPIAVEIPPAAQTTDTTESESCMQSLGFIVTVAVLAVLLIVAMVAVIFMFTARRRELQKQGA